MQANLNDESKYGAGIYVNSVYPGTVKSDLQRYDDRFLIKAAIDAMSTSTENGAITQQYLAISPQAK
jgi:hypothetical protein